MGDLGRRKRLGGSCISPQYGTNWCGDCRRSKLFLDTYGLVYDWVDIEQDAEAALKVMEINGGRSVPTIVFRDGSILVEPSNAELAQQLGVR